MTQGAGDLDSQLDERLVLDTEMDPDQLRKALKSYEPWRYAIDFTNGVSTTELARLDPFVDKPVADRLHVIRPYLPDLDGKRVLDVGCNIGHYLFYLRQRARIDGVGIDRQRRHIQVARFLADLSPTVADLDFRVGDGHLEDLARQDRRQGHRGFDVILHFAVLDFLSSPLNALRNATALLAPGGVLLLVCTTYHAEDPNLIWLDERPPPGRGCYAFGPGAIRTMLTSDGDCDVDTLLEWRPHDADSRLGSELFGRTYFCATKRR